VNWQRPPEKAGVITTIYVYIIVVLFITRKGGWSAFFSLVAKNDVSQISGCVEVKLVAVLILVTSFVMTLVAVGVYCCYRTPCLC
jgi:hypothetical protein